MSARSIGWPRPMFVIAGVYDLVLGVGMLLLHREFYARWGITPPNHDAYVQFPALVVALFGLAFLMIARDPVANRPLVRLGILFKLAYAAPVLWHAVFGTIPMVWVVFAWCDLAFAMLFILALARIPSHAPAHHRAK